MFTDDALLELYARHEAALETEEYISYRDILCQTVRAMADEEGIVLSPGAEEVLPNSLGDWPAFPDTTESLKTLGKKYRLAILSNIDDDLFLLSAERHLGG